MFRVATCALLVCLWALPVVAQAPADNRPTFDLKSLKARGFAIESRADLPGIGAGLTLVILGRTVPEAEGTPLARISRVFVLDGERVVLDSFAFDRIGDAVEPGPAERTFYAVSVKVVKGTRGKAPVLVLSGGVPLQAPGETPKTGSRVLVLSLSNGRFERMADATATVPVVMSGSSLRIDL